MIRWLGVSSPDLQVGHCSGKDGLILEACAWSGDVEVRSWDISFRPLCCCRPPSRYGCTTHSFTSLILVYHFVDTDPSATFLSTFPRHSTASTSVTSFFTCSFHRSLFTSVCGRHAHCKLYLRVWEYSVGRRPKQGFAVPHRSWNLFHLYTNTRLARQVGGIRCNWLRRRSWATACLASNGIQARSPCVVNWLTCDGTPSSWLAAMFCTTWAFSCSFFPNVVTSAPYSSVVVSIMSMTLLPNWTDKPPLRTPHHRR